MKQLRVVNHKWNKSTAIKNYVLIHFSQLNTIAATLKTQYLNERNYQIPAGNWAAATALTAKFDTITGDATTLARPEKGY